ncbi:MAG: hypothetical protein AB7K24_25905 [Gemmataceae bacterium]
MAHVVRLAICLLVVSIIATNQTFSACPVITMSVEEGQPLPFDQLELQEDDALPAITINLSCGALSFATALDRQPPSASPFSLASNRSVRLQI